MIRYSFAILSLIISCSAFAQSEAIAEYEKFKEQAQNSYADFRKKANQEYADFLKQAWAWYEVGPSLPKPQENTVPPVVYGDNDPVIIEDNPIVIEEEIDVPVPEPQPVPIVPIREQPSPTEATITVNLHGTDFSVRASEDLKFKMGGSSNLDCTEAWERLSSPEYNNLIRDLLELRITKRLSDWAYLQLVDAVSEKLMGRDTNEAEILKAYIYSQSGYQMRLALVNEKIKMLFGSKHQIYEYPYFEIDGVYYYAGKDVPEEIQISQASFPGEKPMSLYISQQPLLAGNQTKNRVIKSSDVDWMNASVKEDLNLMSYFSDYPVSQIDDNPLTRWAMYALTPLSEVAQTTLYPTLKEWIKERPAADAVDYLCHWIQTGFEYEYDDKIWGQDRAFFADETLHYPYCDCEDRSILLTRIVRDLLGLDCALVYYPGHLATAIALGEDARGDYIRIDGKKYIVCDPTYINAPIGMTMPGMDNTAAKVIVLK